MPKRPKAISIHTAARHAGTRTPLLYIVQKAVISLIHFPASFIRLWPSWWFDLGNRDTVGRCSYSLSTDSGLRLLKAVKLIRAK